MKIMETEIVSTENVKPAYPTPLHLKNYKLSMLDQLIAPMLVPLVLFFPNTNTDHESFISHTTELLKSSLSVILTRFFPLAGRISNDGLSIDCNDEGVPFSVAMIKGHNLSELLVNPDQHLPLKLIPCEVKIDTEVGGGGSLVLIQVSHFDCGGIAVGAVFWHKVVDATAMGSFLSSWAAIARGSKEAVCPNYITRSLFPHKEELQNQPASLGSLFRKGKSIMRRYVFDASTITELKTKSGVERPTRVEVVSALLWKCFMAASLANNKSVSLLTHVVNLRRRAEPPFPSDCFGNFPGLAPVSSTNEDNKDLGQLVKEIRGAISKINGDYVNRMMGDDGLSGHFDNQRRIWSGVPEGADLLCFSSWCGFGFYDVDFGWGKPIWLSRCDAGSDVESAFLNMVWLIDTKASGGIEAWVTLDEKYMEIFHKVELGVVNGLNE